MQATPAASLWKVLASLLLGVTTASETALMCSEGLLGTNKVEFLGGSTFQTPASPLVDRQGLWCLLAVVLTWGLPSCASHCPQF